jgi:hypothetical protein
MWACKQHNLAFMFYDRMFNMKSMTGAISGAETVHSSGSTEFRLNSEAPIAQSLVFCVLFCRTLFVFYLVGIVSGVIVVLFQSHLHTFKRPSENVQ